jgi:hypothetical protein
MDKEILSLSSQIDELKVKKQFMIDNNVAEFDETQYKVFKTLSTIDNKDLSSLDKSKLIAELIKS